MAKCSYISLGAIFHKFFTSPIALPELPYQGAIRLRNVSIQSPNQETLTEYTGEPLGENETFPKDLGLSKSTRDDITADIAELITQSTGIVHNDLQILL